MYPLDNNYFHWETSQNGNPHADDGLSHVTVFARKNGGYGIVVDDTFLKACYESEEKAQEAYESGDPENHEYARKFTDFLPPTKKQTDYLRNLGVRETPATVLEASRLIEEAREGRGNGGY
jgi:hypothetical protein